MSSNLESRAKLACLYAGGVWGLFWIPLRALERSWYKWTLGDCYLLSCSNNISYTSRDFAPEIFEIRWF